MWKKNTRGIAVLLRVGEGVALLYFALWLPPKAYTSTLLIILLGGFMIDKNTNVHDFFFKIKYKRINDIKYAKIPAE